MERETGEKRERDIERIYMCEFERETHRESERGKIERKDFFS